MQDFFSNLFDFSFRKFVTPGIAGVIFGLSIVMAAMSSIAILRAPMGFLVAPIFFITAVVFSRAGIELILAVFQIARYSAEVARRGRTNEPEAADGDAIS